VDDAALAVGFSPAEAAAPPSNAVFAAVYAAAAAADNDLGTADGGAADDVCAVGAVFDAGDAADAL
jgi:hypothetical protein